MATLLRGKAKGQTVRLIQWANDWFHCEMSDGSLKIVPPTSLKLDQSEVLKVAADRHKGQMLNWFVLSSDGVFTKRRS